MYSAESTDVGEPQSGYQQRGFDFGISVRLPCWQTVRVEGMGHEGHPTEQPQQAGSQWPAQTQCVLSRHWSMSLRPKSEGNRFRFLLLAKEIERRVNLLQAS